MKKLMVYESQKKPYVLETANTRDTYKELIGEDLAFYPIQLDDEGIFQMVVNDTAILNQLPKNRRIYRGDMDFDSVRGTFIIAALHEGETVSMKQKYIDFMIENDFEWSKDSDPDTMMKMKTF